MIVEGSRTSAAVGMSTVKEPEEELEQVDFLPRYAQIVLQHNGKPAHKSPPVKKFIKQFLFSHIIPFSLCTKSRKNCVVKPFYSLH
ncbi:hypothetical protein TNCV_3577671 [Trichonephila clavipes]|uniref:Uncharacterized protein n=1 Tax=Trichonephila clavipes TaxID=2585209 RepID=A0A8X6V1P5_TRICX|nr:hypothetical protein TNCV_3577671 [Trichonephila clavipes]